MLSKRENSNIHPIFTLYMISYNVTVYMHDHVITSITPANKVITLAGVIAISYYIRYVHNIFQQSYSRRIRVLIISGELCMAGLVTTGLL